MNKNEIANLASDIYAEVNGVLQHHNTSEELRDEIAAIFEENYGASTAPRLFLDRLSWAEIAEIAERGDAPRHFRVGDTKTVELLTGEKIEVVILGFNHDILSDTDADKEAAISFGMRGVLDGWYEFNTDDTNRGGWRDSKMRTVYMERFYKLLPEELQRIIKPVVKLTGTGGGSDEITSTDDKLFLLSLVEVTGNEEYVATGEGTQYEYFKQTEAADDADDNATYDRDKCVKRRDGAATIWWLRSPITGNATNFMNIYSTGYIYNYYLGYASGVRGVSFGFCI